MNRDHSERLFWNQLGCSNLIDFSESSLYVHSLSDIKTTQLISLAQSRGINITNKNNASVWLIVVDAMNDPRLTSLNQYAKAEGISLLVLKPIGVEIEYAFFGESSACWACFEKRHQLLDGPAAYLNHTLSLSRPITEPVSYTPTSTTLAFSLIIIALEKYLLSTTRPSMEGVLHSFNLESMQTTNHLITRLPHCACCGNQQVTNVLPTPPQILIHQKMA